MSDGPKLLIEIETLLKDQGAEKTLQVLREAQKQLTQQTRDQQSDQATLNKTMERSASVARIFSMAMNGTAEGFRSAGNAAGAFFSTLGKLSVVGAALSLLGALVAIGTQLKDKFIGAKKSVSEVSEEAKKAQSAWKDAVTAINETSFNNLRKELDNIKEGYEQAAEKAEVLARIQIMLSKSSEEKELAELDLEAATTGMPEQQKTWRAMRIKRQYSEDRFDKESKVIDEQTRLTESQVSTDSDTIKGLKTTQNEAAERYNALIKQAIGAGLETFMKPWEIKSGDFQAGWDRIKKTREGNIWWEPDAALDKKLGVLDSLMPKLMGAFAKESQAAREYDKVVPGKENEILSLNNKIAELKARKEDLSNRRQSSDARYRIQVEEQLLAEQGNPSKPGDHVSKLQAANRYEAGMITDSILPQYRDRDGMRYGGQIGAETRRQSVDLIREATAKVLRKSDDPNEDAAVLDDLMAALNRMGTVTTEGFSKMRDRILLMDKTTAEIRRRVADIETREQAKDAFNP